jgi:hypothetical protein
MLSFSAFSLIYSLKHVQKCNAKTLQMVRTKKIKLYFMRRVYMGYIFFICYIIISSDVQDPRYSCFDICHISMSVQRPAKLWSLSSSYILPLSLYCEL